MKNHQWLHLKEEGEGGLGGEKMVQYCQTCFSAVTSTALVEVTHYFQLSTFRLACALSALAILHSVVNDFSRLVQSFQDLFMTSQSK